MGLNSIEITYEGDHDKTTRALRKLKGKDWAKMLAKFGDKGVKALREATPKRSGLTAESWGYELNMPEPGKIQLIFTNSNVVNRWANVAILIQYGHATRNGGWVEGIDYINPALKPIFDELAKECWQEVKDDLSE